jgi:hypothetical protein
MCRSIHTLYNVDPPVTGQEVQAASLQYVRKISGFRKPSKANEVAFNAAVDDIAAISSRLIAVLETNSSLRERQLRAKVNEIQQSTP